MSDFEAMWQSTKHNQFSYLYPEVVAGGVVILICLFWIRRPLIRRILKVTCILLTAALAVAASNLEIEEKWRLRTQMSEKMSLSDEQTKALAADGANRAIGPYAGGAAALAIIAGIQLSATLISKLWSPFR